MKRSRAYDDLVALAEEAEAVRGDACCALLGGWEPFPARLGRCKRSRGAMAGAADEDADDSEGDARAFPAARHALQFAMELTDAGLGLGSGACSTASSSTGSLSSVADGEDDDVLPLRRNSREHILLRQQQKKQRRRQVAAGSEAADAAVAGSMAEDALRSTPETPEARVLRAGYAQCIDPLDKCQPSPPAAVFDVPAFVLLSISPQPLR
jgi:hypothetical protein